MKDSITEERLMSFLYGEVTAEERKEIGDYLQNNPQKQKELEELGKLRTVLSAWQDHEDIEKPDLNKIYATSDSYQLWKRMAIAASVALFMMLGWMGYSNFNHTEDNHEPLLTQDQLVKLLEQQEKVAAQNEKLLGRITELENQLTGISEDQQKQQAQLINLSSTEVTLKSQLQQYASVMQQQNKQVMDEYFQTLNLQQQQYLQTILTDFDTYITEQREQDMLILQTRMDYLEQNAGEFQNVTAQLMSNLTNSDIQLENQ